MGFSSCHGCNAYASSICLHHKVPDCIGCISKHVGHCCKTGPSICHRRACGFILFSNHTICEHAHLSSFHPSFIYQIKQGRIYFNSIGDEFPITSLVLVEHGYNIDVTMMVMMMLAISPPSNSWIPHKRNCNTITATRILSKIFFDIFFSEIALKNGTL